MLSLPRPSPLPPALSPVISEEVFSHRQVTSRKVWGESITATVMFFLRDNHRIHPSSSSSPQVDWLWTVSPFHFLSHLSFFSSVFPSLSPSHYSSVLSLASRSLFTCQVSNPPFWQEIRSLAVWAQGSSQTNRCLHDNYCDKTTTRKKHTITFTQLCRLYDRRLSRHRAEPRWIDCQVWESWGKCMCVSLQ